jgi:putative PIG3 family NAD(P)H quinone oxidoreductase
VHAVVITRPGPPDVLSSTNVPDPVAGPGEVLVDVAATAVNSADLLQRRGACPTRRGAPSHPGLECSGTIAALGVGVVGWSIGDRVCALLAGGGYAERVAVPAAQLLPLPDNVDLVEAAALPEAACTVHSNLGMIAGLRAGRSVLVHGGSGGIGTMAIQWSWARGARVFATAGTAAGRARCSELGAHVAIDHHAEDFADRIMAETGGEGVNAILDVIGSAYLERNLRALADDGHLIVIGTQDDHPADLDLGALMHQRATITATTLRERPPDQKARIVAAVRGHVWPYVGSGAIRPVVDRVLPLSDAAEAHRALEAGEAIGKIVLRVGA